MLDAWQRSILFLDVLRKQGNTFKEHNDAGMPPVLEFGFETIIDGRTLDRPVNYSLAKINPEEGVVIDPEARPVVIVDPRAGHGPGIGGSKKDSEIGMALKNAHPVYFILFYPEPEPGQTLKDVKNTEIFYIKEVIRMHPKAQKPAIIGNCQAGWAVAMLAADHPGIAGPIILNGSPLSYWAGKDGSNPMRYKGGLIGGIWMASLWADLGNGKFDGANLVKGFEDLNPANTMWKKLYNVYSKVDTEEERFLDFERWWNGFFLMTSEEIHFITQNLFVGNKLEQGAIEFEEGKKLDLKNLEEPVIIFASEGDNITPPMQALNWVVKVWGSEEEIKRQQQVIIYLVHKDIGHLGIFVSGLVAKKQHDKMIENLDSINFLLPGLYEMVIDDNPKAKGKKDVPQYIVRYEPRQFKDILDYDDGLEEEEDFKSVNTISEINDNLYRTYLSPIVKMFTNEQTAETLRRLHPNRVPRYIFSDLNPMMSLFKSFAPEVKENRKKVSPGNFFLEMETIFSDTLVTLFDYKRDMGNLIDAFRFTAFYGNSVIEEMFGVKVDSQAAEKAEEKLSQTREEENDIWLAKMDKGGFPAGALRIMLAIASVDDSLDRSEFQVAKEIRRSHPKLKKMTIDQVEQMTSEQSRILQTDQEMAIKALPRLIRTKKDRLDALEIAEKMAKADGKVAKSEKALIKKIQKALKISK